MDEHIEVSEKTKIQLPIGWVLALLAGCATFTGMAFKVGGYVGGNDANATALVQRVIVVEQRVDVLERLDGRLARIEGKLGIYTQPQDSLREPATK
jgi:hypothetical protein